MTVGKICTVQLSDGSQQVLRSPQGFEAIVDAEGYLSIREQNGDERIFIAQHQWAWYKFEDREVI